MSANFVQSSLVRAAALALLRANARMQFGRTGPRILINSIPKAGTHLFTSQLAQVPQLMNSWKWINQDQEIVVDGKARPRTDLDERWFKSQLGQIRNGQYCFGHFHYHPEIVSAIVECDVRTIFVIRHPLDIVVSLFHYIGGLRRHPEHDQFVALPSDEARVEYLINGVAGGKPRLALKDLLQAHRPWLDTEEVLTVRFEDLVGSRGGGSEEARSQAYRGIFSHCGLGDVAVPATETKPATPTFRKGQVKGYMSFFNEERLALLDDETKAAIRSFGYTI